GRLWTPHLRRAGSGLRGRRLGARPGTHPRHGNARQSELSGDSSAPVETTGPEGPVLFWLAAILLLFAPLVRGGNRPLPLFVLELTGLAALAWVAWSRGRRLRARHA